ncbi:MAG: response regulator, partial [Bacteroidales bacterium]|nr:response regulator [Bacteroidales bacterium]
DEYTNMFFLKSAFKGQQFELVITANGEEAVAAFEQSPEFDLVLMDLKLPLMNGFQATKKIKAIRPDVSVIAVTAYALRGDREKALASGCDDYIAKPFLKSELVELVRKYINLA